MSTARASFVLDPRFTVGTADRRLFGSFLEHMGRAVYGGAYEPGHGGADAAGFRADVLELVRELGVTVVRYPGGNFVSGYDWEDGVGPRDSRPTRLDLAWRSLEPNQFGTNEFVDWARAAAVEPMFAVNLGTRGVDAARSLVEYCNMPGGSDWAELRGQHGYPEPHRIRLWCLGNEMDGEWQIGHKEASEYGRLAAAAGRAMRAVDPGIELVVCGSSNSHMPTFGAWEDTVLEHTLDVADYVSLHTYYDPDDYPDVGSYLACNGDLERMIDAVVATCDAVAARKRSRKRIGISLDEWNIWHLARNPPHTLGAPVQAPPIAEDDYTLADALAVGCLLITILRHADRVRIGCLAQLINVLAPIRTLNGGPAWRQTTFFPFQHVARHGQGTVLRIQTESPTYPVDGEGEVPVLELAAVHHPASQELDLFAVNRAETPLSVTGSLTNATVSAARTEHIVLTGEDLAATNTARHPTHVSPTRAEAPLLRNERLELELPAYSWNLVRICSN
jgi:alpha-L-arabinofuranosidase